MWRCTFDAVKRCLTLIHADSLCLTLIYADLRHDRTRLVPDPSAQSKPAVWLPSKLAGSQLEHGIVKATHADSLHHAPLSLMLQDASDRTYVDNTALRRMVSLFVFFGCRVCFKAITDRIMDDNALAYHKRVWYVPSRVERELNEVIRTLRLALNNHPLAPRRGYVAHSELTTHKPTRVKWTLSLLSQWGIMTNPLSLHLFLSAFLGRYTFCGSSCGAAR